jgi:hypothetical protein
MKQLEKHRQVDIQTINDKIDKVEESLKSNIQLLEVRVESIPIINNRKDSE